MKRNRILALLAAFYICFLPLASAEKPEAMRQEKVVGIIEDAPKTMEHLLETDGNESITEGTAYNDELEVPPEEIDEFELIPNSKSLSKKANGAGDESAPPSSNTSTNGTVEFHFVESTIPEEFTHGESAMDAVADSISIDATHFPDADFRECVRSNADKDGNGILSPAEYQSLDWIGIRNSSFTSLKGLEYFNQLKRFQLDNCTLKTLDLRKLTTLECIIFNDSNIKTLDVSGLKNLELVVCQNCKLKTLNVQGCTNLEKLLVPKNALPTLELSETPNLIGLICSDNSLKSLDISPCDTLVSIYLDGKQLDDPDTLVYSLDDGVTTMLAFDQGVKLVTGTDLKQVKVDADSTLSVNVGDRFRITSKKAVNQYQTSDAAVVSVTSGGTAKALKAGKAIITLNLKNGGKYSLTVKVSKATVKPTKITLSPSGSVTLDRSDTLQLKYTLSPSNADSCVEWSSSKSAVAEVDQNGRVTPVKEGTAKITATAVNGGKKAKVTIKVTDNHAPKSIVIDQGKSLSVTFRDKIDNQLQLTASMTAKVEPAKTTLAWSSNKTEIATVDTKSGLVTLLKSGKATITVKTSNGKKASCVLNIKKRSGPAVDAKDANLPILRDPDFNVIDQIELIDRISEGTTELIVPFIGDGESFKVGDTSTVQKASKAVYNWAVRLKAYGVIKQCGLDETTNVVSFTDNNGTTGIYIPPIAGTYSSGDDTFSVVGVDACDWLDKTVIGIADQLSKYRITGAREAADYIKSNIIKYKSVIKLTKSDTAKSVKSMLGNLDENNVRVLFWRGHGNLCNGKVYFILNEKVNGKLWNSKEYIEDRNANRIGWETGLFGQPTKVALSNLFFEKYMAEIEGGLFISGSCNTGLNNSMVQTLYSKGFDAYIAPKGEIWTTYSDKFLGQMAVHLCEQDKGYKDKYGSNYDAYITVEEAFARAQSDLGKTDLIGVGFRLFTSRPKQPFRLIPLRSRLRVNVVDENGKQISGATVTLTGDQFKNPVKLSQERDNKGNILYYAEDLLQSPMICSIEVSAKNYSPETVDVMLSEPMHVITCTLKGDGVITGRVVNKMTGEGLSGMDVLLLNIDTKEVSTQRITKSNGSFTYSELPYGQYRLTFATNGYTPQTREITLSEKKKKGELNQIELVPNGKVSAFVEDLLTGEKLSGVTVQMKPSTDKVNSIIKKTDKNGAFSFDDLAYMSYTMTLKKEGYQDKEIRVSPSLKQKHWDMGEIDLEPIGEVSGYVYDESTGNKLPVAKVAFELGNIDKTVNVDKNGNYKLQSLPLKSIMLTATADGYYPCSKTVDLSKNVKSTKLNFPMKPLTAITGVVTDAKTGQKLSDVEVQYARSDGKGSKGSVKTDRNGNYNIMGVDYADYHLVFSLKGYIDYSTNAQPTSANTVVTKNMALLPF